MKTCVILLAVGLLLAVDGIFGVIRRVGIPIPPQIGAPLGFLLIVLSMMLNSAGIC